ncbi:MAG: hypothetical protein CYG60_20550 [Actinobacteria bacterium]|nr:MAG: hypothetical protein CYG60_20550 [Actinomycetota bacterium]
MDLWDRAAAELDQFIETPAEQTKAQREREMAWKASVREFHRKRYEQNRLAWLRHHQHMQALHLDLAGEHAAKARRFEEREGGGGER